MSSHKQPRVEPPRIWHVLRYQRAYECGWLLPWGKKEREYGKSFEKIAVVSEDEGPIRAVPHRTRQVKEQKPRLLSGITQWVWEENAV